MAKNEDIISVMFGWIVSLISWILGGIVKLAVALITGLFTGIIGLFKKKGHPIQD